MIYSKKIILSQESYFKIHVLFHLLFLHLKILYQLNLSWD